MANHKLSLGTAQVTRLLTYLERLACYADDGPPRVQSKIIRQNIIELMSDVTEQTGVSLGDMTFATKPSTVTEDDCNHIVTARSVCSLCGKTGLVVADSAAK